jgi:hypothetical protein
MPKASALIERSKRMYFFVHSNFPEQTAMVGILSSPIMPCFERHSFTNVPLQASFFAARTSGRTRHFHSSHHAITPELSATRKFPEGPICQAATLCIRDRDLLRLCFMRGEEASLLTIPCFSGDVSPPLGGSGDDGDSSDGSTSPACSKVRKYSGLAWLLIVRLYLCES